MFHCFWFICIVFVGSFGVSLTFCMFSNFFEKEKVLGQRCFIYSSTHFRFRWLGFAFLSSYFFFSLENSQSLEIYFIVYESCISLKIQLDVLVLYCSIRPHLFFSRFIDLSYITSRVQFILKKE